MTTMSAESLALKDSNYYSKVAKSFTNFHDLSLRQSIQDYDTWSLRSSDELGHCKDVARCRKAAVCIDDETGVTSGSNKYDSVCRKKTEEVRRLPLSTRCYSSNALTLVSKSFGQTGICMSSLEKEKKKKLMSEDWNPAEVKKLSVQAKKSVVSVNSAVSSILLRRAPSIVFEDIGGIANSSWSDGLATVLQTSAPTQKPNLADSSMGSFECWDYSMELECLNGQDGKLRLCQKLRKISRSQ